MIPRVGGTTPTAEATSSAKSEAEKRERAILKKLRQALAVQQEHADGKSLNEAQQAKVLMASHGLSWPLMVSDYLTDDR